MGQQNFGRILRLIFLSTKTYDNVGRKKKQHTKHLRGPKKNDSNAEQNKTTEMTGTTALIFLSLNSKSTTSIVSDNLPQEKSEFIHNVRTAWSVGHCSEDNSTSRRQVAGHRPPALNVVA
jgi:hypothetical protein